MYRTFVILRHTFIESIVQPIYPLLLALGTTILTVYGFLPFFTLSEDTVMFKDVGIEIIMILVLIVTLFATSRTVFDEIEDRTMLTLMSKPVKRWEVLLGKYLGIISATLLAVAILGVVLIVVTWMRIPGDYMLDRGSLDDRVQQQISDWRWMHFHGLAPMLALVWLQVSVLAAIGVALSTRFSLVVNLPLVIFLYMAGHLTRFLPVDATTPVLARWASHFAATVLPYLETYDLKAKAIYGKVAVAGFDGTAVSVLWTYVAVALAYTTAYSVFALTAGLWLFRSRELGGAEG